MTVMMSVAGQAQLAGFYPFCADGVSLNNAEVAMLVDKVNELLKRPHLANEAPARMRNHRTGNNGAISVTHAFHGGTTLSPTLTYETIATATRLADNLVLNWSQTTDGSW